MRIAYLSGSYVPSPRASSIQVMNMCAAWSRLGHTVTLVTKRCPPREAAGVDDPFAYYGIEHGFEIRKLPRPDWRGGGIVFRLAASRFVARALPATDLFYCREIHAAAAAARRGAPFVFEAHSPPSTARALRLHGELFRAPSCRGVVAISRALLRRLEEQPGIGASVRRLVAHDGADPRLARNPSPAPELASTPRPRVGYVGHLHRGKGSDFVPRLAERCPEVVFHVVGGEAPRADGPEPARNLVCHGFVAPARVSRFYAGLDVVLLPYDTQVFGAAAASDLAPWMSPLKMFEAMAAGKAILASDLPVLREVLEDGENCLLLPPRDADAWVAAIERLRVDTELREKLGERAHRDFVGRYSWDRRAARILEELDVGA